MRYDGLLDEATDTSCSVRDSSDRPLQILYVTGLKDGGVAHYIINLARGMRDRGMSVVVAGPPSGPLADGIAGLYGVRFIGFGSARMATFPADLKQFLGEYRECNAAKFDIIHSHGIKGGLLTAIASLCPHEGQFIYSSHCTSIQAYRGRRARVLYAMECWAARRHDTFLAVCDAERHEAIGFRMNRKKISVVYPGVTMPDTVDCSDHRLNSPRPVDHAFVIGALGRLEWQKGYDQLLKSIPRVSDRFPGVKVLIGGSGSLGEGLRELAGELGIEERVTFVGWVDDRYSFLSRLDAFVLPSRWEAMPATILEAGMAKLPVIATDVGGVREMINNSTGWLIPSNDAGLLAEAIIDCLSRREVAARRASRFHERVTAECSLDNVTDCVLLTYRKGLAKANKPGLSALR